MLRSITKRFLSAFKGSVELYGSIRKVSSHDLYATQVRSLGEHRTSNAGAVTDIGTEKEYASKAASRDEVAASSDNLSQKEKRFRRSREELRLGLTIEQAMAQRTPKPEERVVRPKKSAEPKSPKQLVRFRRTEEEIRLGLTKEQAAAQRGVALPVRQTTSHGIKAAEGRIGARSNSALDLIETLPAKIQVRASAVQRYRLGGGKAALKADTLDLIEKAMAAGKFTVCPPFVDSDGFNHLTGKEA
jgi:hypothetical protein